MLALVQEASPERQQQQAAEDDGAEGDDADGEGDAAEAAEGMEGDDPADEGDAAGGSLSCAMIPHALLTLLDVVDEDGERALAAAVESGPATALPSGAMAAVSRGHIALTLVCCARRVATAAAGPAARCDAYVPSPFSEIHF